MCDFYVQSDNKTRLEVNKVENCKADWLTLGLIELNEDEEPSDTSIVKQRNPYVSPCDNISLLLFEPDFLFSGPEITLGELKNLFFS